MIAARAAGVPVAELYDHGEGALGRAYLLMERLDGETIPRRLLRDDAYAAARPGLAHRLGEVLARIHQIDPDRLPGLPQVDAFGQLTELYQGFAEPRPALEIGLRWLREHQPAPVADTLVHGDFRTGNLMIAADGLRGVLDWELTHRGDPRQDLGWLCTKAWRFGSARPVGGFGPRADLMAGYAAGGGTPPDEADPALVGAVRHGALGAALPQPGRTVPVRRRALGRARGAGPPGLRAGVRRAARAGPRHPAAGARSASGPRVPARSAP